MSGDAIIESIETMIDKLYDLMFDITADVDGDDEYDTPQWQVRDELDEAMEKLQDARMKAMMVLK